jgi:hypothetical protein
MCENLDFVFKDNKILLSQSTPWISQSAGFFSCASVRLDAIIQYYNRFEKLPEEVDSTGQFRLYKRASDQNRDIAPLYFCAAGATPNAVEMAPAPVYFKENFQGLQYNTIEFAPILPFVRNYFTPTSEILQAVDYIEKKYAIDYKNTCVLFYRGLDKATEFVVPTYQQVFSHARKVAPAGVRFLIQSDELEFIEAAMTEFGPDAFVFADESRVARRQIGSVDKMFYDRGENFYYSQLFLAIVLVMSKCKHVICNTGNISMWICLYRGRAANVHQYLGEKFISTK